MTTIYIRNVPADVLARIDAAAARERRSRNAQLLIALERIWPETPEERRAAMEAAVASLPGKFKRSPEEIAKSKPAPTAASKLARDLDILARQRPAPHPPVETHAVPLGPVPPKPGARLKPSKGKA